MTISGSMAIPGMDSYRISSVHGNPSSIQPVQKIGKDADSSKALVIAEPAENEDDLYVKEFEELEAPTSTATGDFAEILTIQEEMMGGNEERQQKQDMYSQLNDTIGVMGYQNLLRDRLMGNGFEPFLEQVS